MNSLDQSNDWHLIVIAKIIKSHREVIEKDDKLLTLLSSASFVKELKAMTSSLGEESKDINSLIEELHEYAKSNKAD